MNDYQFLASIPIFSDCHSHEIVEISHYLKQRENRSGEIIFHEGDPGNELFIVKSGLVETLLTAVCGSEKIIASFGPGDYFGEMSIIDNALRSATCRVKKDALLYVMSQASFFKLMLVHPQIAIKIMYRMLNITTQRLIKTSRFISDMVRWGNDASRRAITDETTGVYNRRYLENLLNNYFYQLNDKEKTCCSLIMMDLDRFREINEKYGPAVGNKLLAKVVEVLKKYFAPTDVIARYGGDEFTIFLPQTDLNEARQRALRVCQALAEAEFCIEGLDLPLKVTTSQGIAAFPSTCNDLASLRTQADKALYQAKEAGRNQVKVICSVS